MKRVYILKGDRWFPTVWYAETEQMARMVFAIPSTWTIQLRW